ncbi:MAG: hypothetical protein FWC27_10665 [Firmicutes bacterium]|nr:hypothetical protein [Bacillota bacterium]
MSDNNPRYQKLGGWLLCVVILFFLQTAGLALQFGEGGAMDVIRGWQMYIGAQGYLLLAGQAVSMLLNLIYVFAAIAIVQRDPGFLRTRQLAFAALAVNILVQLAYGLLYGFQPSGKVLLALQGAGCVLWPLVAMRYYSKSARVKAYMGSDEYLRLAFFGKCFSKKANHKTEEGDL